MPRGSSSIREYVKQTRLMKKHISLFFKGLAMGSANVIPGVSGGTIAFITGIFERLIGAIKSFNLTAIKLFFSGKWKEFAEHIDFKFLLAVMIGIAVSVISIAQLFKFLFTEYPVYIWSFFLGLIIASIYFVGKTIKKWDYSVIISMIIGIAITSLIAFTNPASESDNFLYLILCGIVAACSMILPGLSGSFVLILLGNYELVMINAVIEGNVMILLPVIIGAGIGLIAFSHILSWIFKKFPNQTISLLTGFIIGSIIIIYPWKDEVVQVFGGKEKVVGYNWYLPIIDNLFFMAFGCIILGAASLIAIELIAKRKEKKEK